MTERKIMDNEALFADVEQIIGGGGRIELRVKGESMRPFLRGDRDIVSLSPIGAGELRRGMVTLFRYRGRHVLHRISRIEGNRVEMKGDGNYRRAEYVTRGDVSAYVDSTYRGGRLIRYGSLRWKLITVWSLSVKAARTLYRDILRNVGGKRD